MSRQQTALHEQRQSERARASLFAIWEMTQASVSSADVINFSADGCFMHSRNGLPTKPEVDLQLRLPTERWIQARGRIVRTSEPDGFGVHFTQLTDEDRTMLGLLVEYYRDGH
ncbi:MAG: PilZ domain-containing protein [Pyrinomonadaceae bacterium]|nr:PilZ domain-containing protein [Pyrinomonadaceae bacterium]